MRYIDFDGVILDTEPILFREWRKNPNRHLLAEEVKIRYIQAQNWDRILHESMIINDSIEILKSMNPNESTILTKVHSYDNEMKAKYDFLKSYGVKQKIIFVPHFAKKTDCIDPKGAILVDDSLRNLHEWQLVGGYPQFFDKKGDNIDSWHQYNEYGFQRVRKINEPRL